MRKITYIALLLFTFSTYAQNIKWFEGGFWFNPDESGRGLTIEVQKNIAVIAFYAYDDNQIGRWYLGSGVIDFDTNSVSGNWDAFDGGQCAGCPYMFPEINESQSKGAFTITAHSYRTATMQWAGGEMPLERFSFAYPDNNTYLLGVWSVVREFNGVLISEFVILNERIQTDSGELVVGYSLNTGRDIVAAYIGDDELGNPLFGAVYDVDNNFNSLFQFNTGVGAMSGLAWLYPKDGEPTGSGDFFIGAKFLDLISLSKNAKFIEQNIDYDEIYNSAEIKGKFNKKYLSNVKALEHQLNKYKETL